MTTIDIQCALTSQLAYDFATWKDEERGVELYKLPVAAGFDIFAFRGTEFDFDDILRDMRAFPWWDRELGLVHAGFLKGARSMLGFVLEDLQTFKRPFYLTGHSKGGAETLVLGAKLALRGFVPRGIVTFGAPRVQVVGSGIEKALGGVDVRRYVHGMDVVPEVPKWIWGGAGKHVGEKVEIGVRGHRFRDHRIAGYIAAMKRRAKMSEI